MKSLLRSWLHPLVAGSILASANAATAAANFRVRSDFAAPLNAAQGWAGAPDEHVTLHADEPFRLRFEIESAPTGRKPREFRLQYRRNGGEWIGIEAHDFPHPESENAKTPRVSIVSCAAFQHGAATLDLLSGSKAAFRAGSAVSLSDRTTAWDGAGGHGEFEWPLVVRRFADGAVTNEAGDTFEFRMIAGDGMAVDGSRNPLLRLAIRPGHVGGTFVETPGRIGPWQAANGDLYFIMEPAETSNLFMMIKSSDGGRSWREVDSANRPPTRDLESVDARLVGDTIHIIHQVTRSVRYHSFRTSDHRTHPDTWDVRAEEAGAVQSVAQAASLVVRPDSSLVAFYVGQTKVRYSVRSSAGKWSGKGIIESAVGPQAVLGADGVVHLAYYCVDGTVWYRRLLPDDTLTPAVQLASGLRTTRAEFVSVLPLVFIAQTNTAVVVFRQSTGFLWERRIGRDGEPSAAVQVSDRTVVQNAVDSQQPGADVVGDGPILRVLLIDDRGRAIFSTDDSAGWQPSRRQVDGILGSWVRGNIYTRPDGTKVYGYIYDAGSDGGAGMNRFAELVLGRPAR